MVFGAYAIYRLNFAIFRPYPLCGAGYQASSFRLVIDPSGRYVRGLQIGLAPTNGGEVAHLIEAAGSG
jgi:hypothetical protein